MLKSCIISFLLVASVTAGKNWDYTFTSLDVNVVVDYVKTEINLVKIKRGDYAINGTFVLDQELTPKYKV